MPSPRPGCAMEPVGIESGIIFAGFISLIAWMHSSSTPAVPSGDVSHEAAVREVSLPAEPGEGTRPVGRAAVLRSIRADLVKFGAAALAILAAAPFLVDTADGIAREAQLGESFVGVSAILLMAIVAAGIAHGARTRVARLELGSGMTLVTYFVLMSMIFTAGA